MRLGYFTMPVHPMGRDWSQTLQEDREAIILADKLGFYDAFVGEHLTDACENITNSMMFHATLIHDTKKIKLATGTTNLAQMHPVRDRGQCRDVRPPGAGPLHHRHQRRRAHLRFRSDRNSGRGPQQDVRRSDRRRSWQSGSAIRPTTSISRTTASRSVSHHTAALELGVGIMAKPFQKPRPEIVGTVVAPFSPGVVLMGKRDFHPLSANFLLSKPSQVALDATTSRARRRSEPKPDIADWRVARTIFVADDDKVAARYGRDDAEEPYRFYFEQMRAKMKRGNRLYVFKSSTRNSPMTRSPTITSWTTA